MTDEDRETGSDSRATRKESPSFEQWLGNGIRMIRSKVPNLSNLAKAILGGLWTAFVAVSTVVYGDAIKEFIPVAASLGVQVGRAVLGLPMLVLLFAWVIYRQRKIRRQLDEIQQTMEDIRTDGGKQSGDVVVLIIGGLAGAAIGTYFESDTAVLGGALIGAYLLWVYDQRTQS